MSIEVEIRKHLLWHDREVILAKRVTLPFPPFQGLKIEFDEAADWEETVESVRVNGDGSVRVYMEWWPSCHRPASNAGLAAFNAEDWPGFHIVWDSRNASHVNH